MTKPNFDDIDQIPVVHVSVQSTGDETIVKYESNEENLLNEVVSQIDKKVFIGQPSIPINPKTNQPYFEIKPDGWGDGWKVGEVSEFDFIDDKLVPVKPK